MAHFNIQTAKESTIIWNDRPMYIIENKYYGYEPFFKDFVMMAYVDIDNKEVRPTHGYFLPQNFSKITFTLKTLNTPLPFICGLYKGFKLNNN